MSIWAVFSFLFQLLRMWNFRYCSRAHHRKNQPRNATV